MAITDLTGYTWTGNITQSYIMPRLSWLINFDCSGETFAMFRSDAAGLFYEGKQVFTLSTHSWSDNKYSSFTISGGSDATNTTLISFLQTYGTLSLSKQVSKVVYGDKTLIDLTADTITADDLLQGVTAHDMAGQSITGTLVVPTPPSGTFEVLQNGTYDITEYAEVDVNVSTPNYDGTVENVAIKGDIITLDLGNGSKQYRVLKANGNIVELVSMYAPISTWAVNAGQQNIYTNSALNTEILSFYDTLSTVAKSAIQDTNITQYGYTSDSSIYNALTHASYANYSTKMVKANVGNRKMYALDVADIEEYFDGTFGQSDIWKLLFNTSTTPQSPFNSWLRSGTTNANEEGYYINGTNGNIMANLGRTTLSVAVAFHIDLSKITWS